MLVVRRWRIELCFTRNQEEEEGNYNITGPEEEKERPFVI